MKLIRKLLKWTGILFLLFILINMGVYTYAKITPPLQIKSANSFMLFDNKNNVFFQGSGSREWISLKEISKNVITATIATEDQHFYLHKGFDFPRIISAGVTNILSRSKSQGASTISQQYAKNLFLDFDKTWKRKWDEMWYTIELEADYSKDEILEGYLNTINYGHGMYGIENASQFYFGKSASELDLAESAMLVGIPKSPSHYSPITNLENAKKRQKYVLKAMRSQKKITEEAYQEAIDEELTYVGEKKSQNLSTIMYYQDAVMKELQTIKEIPSTFLETGGLKIYTNLDLEEQTKLENTIQTVIPKESTIETATIVMNPNNGKVLALVGGRDYNRSPYNRAIDAKRQVGSTMKPYLYYAALENGFTASSTFTSEKTTFTYEKNKTYSPQNNNETYGNKPISMATAIAYSENIYAVKTHTFLGYDTLINMARRVGITSDLQAVPSLALGTSEISMLEMVTGYSCFANLGYKVTPHFIERIEDSEGNILYQAKEERELVLNPNLTFILNNLLTATYDSAYIDYNYPTAISIASKLTHQYALKSGTTNTDTWYIGYNHDVITATWCGYDQNQDVVSSEYKYARDIWLQTIEGYMDGKEDVWYEKPDGVSATFVEPISGRLATEQDEKKKMVYFLKGTEPLETTTVFDELLEKEETQ